MRKSLRLAVSRSALTLYWGILCALYVATAPNAGAPIEFRNGRHIQLGRLDAGHHRASFGMRNLLTERVVVTDVTASCGCLSAKVTPPVMSPGEDAVCSFELDVIPNISKDVMILMHLSGASRKWSDSVFVSFSGLGRGKLVPREREIRFDQEVAGYVAIQEVVFVWVGRAEEARKIPWRFTAEPHDLLMVHSETVHFVGGDANYSCLLRAAIPVNGQVVRGEVQLSIGTPQVAESHVGVLLRATDDIRVSPMAMASQVPQGGGALGDLVVTCKSGWMFDHFALPTWLAAERTDRLAGTSALSLTAVGGPSGSRLAGRIGLFFVGSENRKSRVDVSVAVEVRP